MGFDDLGGGQIPGQGQKACLSQTLRRIVIVVLVKLDRDSM
jgi:hypothetical protein